MVPTSKLLFNDVSYLPSDHLMKNSLLDESRRKKLCFSCKEPWEPGHRCMGKGKVHYIEVVSDSDEEEDVGEQERDVEQDSGTEQEPQV